MSLKKNDPKGYKDFSSGINSDAVEAFVNGYIPKNNTMKLVVVMIIITILCIIF